MSTLELKPQHSWKFDFIIPADRIENPFRPPRYDAALDDVRSLIKDICVALAKANAQFIVVSPESGAWPVDVATDFPVVIEQIPKFLKFLHHPGPEAFELDFYEQGIQRRIEIQSIGQTLEVVCFSYGDSPMIERSICDVAVWQSMIGKFWKEFSRAAAMVAPLALQHPWWKEWIADLA
jgi:hypothetical protein